MRGSYLLELAASRLTPLLLLVSLWVLYRGHNAPGGGFIGGLVAASAISLYSFAFGPGPTRAYLRLAPERIMGFGVALALGSGLLAWAAGAPFLSGLWTQLPLGRDGIKLGTPLLFDVGVYFTVIGVTTTILLAFEED